MFPFNKQDDVMRKVTYEQQLASLNRSIKGRGTGEKILKQWRKIKELEHKMESEQSKEPKKQRLCGICRFPGHDKRTCPNKDNGIKNEEMSKKNSGERKNCEYNWAELIICLILLYPDIKTKSDVINKISDLKDNTKFGLSGGICNIDKYVADIKLRKDDTIKGFISNFDTSIFEGFESIILSGKSFKGFPKLEEANKLYDEKCAKSDIYILYDNDKIIGISAKASQDATITNYSIEKLFNSMGITHNLKDDRINILKHHFGDEKYKYSKVQRSEANELFYSKDNIYFKNIVTLIEENETLFTKELLSYVFPLLNYDVYGYNGLVLKDLNSLSSKVEVKTQKIIRETKYETETAAKIWFSLYLDDIESWKFCIRGKNDIYKASFQVLEFTKIH